MIQESILSVGQLALTYVSLGYKLPRRAQKFLEDYSVIGVMFVFAYLNSTLKNPYLSIVLTSGILFLFYEDLILTKINESNKKNVYNII